MEIKESLKMQEKEGKAIGAINTAAVSKVAPLYGNPCNFCLTNWKSPILAVMGDYQSGGEKSF